MQADKTNKLKVDQERIMTSLTEWWFRKEELIHTKFDQMDSF
jgi:hypothetical protein